MVADLQLVFSPKRDWLASVHVVNTSNIEGNTTTEIDEFRGVPLFLVRGHPNPTRYDSVYCTVDLK